MAVHACPCAAASLKLDETVENPSLPIWWQSSWERRNKMNETTSSKCEDGSGSSISGLSTSYAAAMTPEPCPKPAPPLPWSQWTWPQEGRLRPPFTGQSTRVKQTARPHFAWRNNKSRSSFPPWSLYSLTVE